MAWNPHKLLGIPLQCSMFVTRHDGLLAEAHATSASYLFQPDKPYDTALDSGDKSTFCGRKVDAFKLWLSWKAHRTSGFGRLVDTAVAGAQYMARGARDRAPHFRMVLATLGEPKVLSQCTSACFWYIPPALLAAEKVLESDDFQRLLGKVSRVLRNIGCRNSAELLSHVFLVIRKKHIPVHTGGAAHKEENDVRGNSDGCLPASGLVWLAEFLPRDDALHTAAHCRVDGVCP